MRMSITSFDNNIIIRSDGGSTTNLVLNTGPSRIKASAITPSIVAIFAEHHHRIAIPSPLESKTDT